MSLVEVTVRQRDGSIVWQRLMDRDAAYFQDFRQNVEADLQAGWSITIVPEEEVDHPAVSRTRWDGLKQ